MDEYYLIGDNIDFGIFPVVFNTELGLHRAKTTYHNSDVVINVENYTLIGPNDAEVTGGDEVNVFSTDRGNDIIHSAGGNDIISSGAGDDYIDAGSGRNEIYGGEGNDTYFSDSRNSGINFITDNEGSSDTLQVLDSIGRDSWRLYKTDEAVIRESFQGQQDVMLFTSEGVKSIENLTWIGDSLKDSDYGADYEATFKTVYFKYQVS